MPTTVRRGFGSGRYPGRELCGKANGEGYRSFPQRRRRDANHRINRIAKPKAVDRPERRGTSDIPDPPDSDDPFSSSITITNTGYMPLDSVTANLSWRTILLPCLGRVASLS